MFRLRIGFLCLVVAFCLLFGVSHSTSESVCVLSDAPQQCSAFCMAALQPLYDQYSKSRQQEQSQEAMVKLIADSQAEQKEIVNSQDAMMKLIAEFRAEEKEVLNVLAANLTASRLESTLQSRPVTEPPGFQKIGSRYFFIEYNERKSWTDAEETCREKGGHLAAFQTEDELEAVTRIVNKYTSFWLGYHRNIEDEFVTANGNKRPFIKWKSEQPTNIGGNEHYVVLHNSSMYTRECDYE